MIYQFRIQIKNITHPPVWRRVTIPSDFTFEDFHYIIQMSFGWYNAHLYEFSPKGYNSDYKIGQKFDDDFDSFHDNLREAHSLKLSEVFTHEGEKFIYCYDFGDNWEHTILLEKMEDKRALFPEIVAGKGACPPEDCGGPWGYMALKEILDDPKHEEYESYREWLGLEGGDQMDFKEYDMDFYQGILTKFFQKPPSKS